MDIATALDLYGSCCGIILQCLPCLFRMLCQPMLCSASKEKYAEALAQGQKRKQRVAQKAMHQIVSKTLRIVKLKQLAATK